MAADSSLVARHAAGGLSILALLIVVRSLAGWMGLEVTPGLWTVGVLITGATMAVTANRRLRLAAILAAVSTCGAWWLLASYKGLDVKLYLLRFVPRYIDFLFTAFKGTLEAVPADLGLFTLGLTLVGAAIGVTTSIARRNFFWPVIVGSSIFVLEYLHYYNESIQHLTHFSVLALAIHSLLLGEDRQAQFTRVTGSEDNYISPFKGFKYGLVALLLISLVLPILPGHFDTLNLGEIGDTVVDVFDGLRELQGGGSGGSGTKAGFGSGSPFYSWWAFDTGLLGGPIDLSPEAALRITIETLDEEGHLDFPIYLKALTYDIYSGSRWRQQRSHDRHWAWNEEELPGYLSSAVPGTRARVTVESIDTITNTLFILGNPLYVVLDDDLAQRAEVKADRDSGLFYQNANGDFILTVPAGLDDGYRYETVVPRWPTPKSSVSSDLEGITGDDQDHLERFLTLPSGPSEGLVWLVDRLVDGKEEAFEKAQALTGYLRRIPYSQTPAPLPEGADLVEHFLFEGREGYCVYHSSALAVMLRIAGIPSRWVQVFIVTTGERVQSPGGVEVNEGAMTFVVPHKNAHSWVEAYIPSLGWVPFEATPAYRGINYSQGAVTKPDAPVGAPGEGPTAGQGSPEQRDFDPLDQGRAETRDGLAGSIGRLARISASAIGVLLLLGIAAAMLYALAALTATVLRDRRYLASASGLQEENTRGTAVEGAFALTLYYLQGFGVRYEPQLTAGDYVRSAAEAFPDAAAELQELLSRYEQAAYGREAEDWDPRDVFRRIMRVVKESAGIWTFIYKRYLGRFY